jgi:hypothetical protein
MILTPFLSNFVQEYQIGPFLLACYELYFEETQSSVAKFMLRKMLFVGGGYMHRFGSAALYTEKSKWTT